MSNPALPKEMKDILKQLKSIMGQYRVMNASTRKRLKALGFQIVQGRGHYKVYYMHDKSRCCTLPSTASEVRTGRNVALNLFRYLIVPYFMNKK